LHLKFINASVLVSADADGLFNTTLCIYMTIAIARLALISTILGCRAAAAAAAAWPECEHDQLIFIMFHVIN
jgi:hypothetical protein